MSDDFPRKEAVTELNSLVNVLSNYIPITKEDSDELTNEDLDRELAIESNAEAIKLAISTSRQDILASCAARVSEESRSRRDIHIAKASRKQLLLSRLNIVYDRYFYLLGKLNS